MPNIHLILYINFGFKIFCKTIKMSIGRVLVWKDFLPMPRILAVDYGEKRVGLALKVVGIFST